VNGDKTTPNNKYIAKLVQKDSNLHVHVCKCFSLICTKKVYVMLDTSQGLFPSDLATHLFFSSWNCAMFLKYILQDSSSFCYLDMLDNWQFLKISHFLPVFEAGYYYCKYGSMLYRSTCIINNNDIYMIQ
jgi:hypothetical protein